MEKNENLYSRVRIFLSTVEPRHNEVLGTMKITGFSLYQDKKTNIKRWDQQNYLVIRGFLLYPTSL